MEGKLIKDFIRKQKAYRKSESNINDFYIEIVDRMLLTAKTEEDFTEIKDRLTVMPMCAAKVCLFRRIMLTSGEITH